MEIIRLIVGNLQTNCYIVTKNNETIIIDPGDEAEKIKQTCEKKNVVAILVTHHHFDHVGALEELENYYQIKHNQWQNKELEIIKTPGHTKDSQSFFFSDENTLFSGDFLFQNGIGRMDLGGDEFDMQKSIQTILEYPKDMQIYPGHGPKTTLKEEEKFLTSLIKKN